MIRKPKSNSSFRSPYLSKRRNENVSMAVMRTPSQRGILKKANTWPLESNFKTKLKQNYKIVINGIY